MNMLLVKREIIDIKIPSTNNFNINNISFEALIHTTNEEEIKTKEKQIETNQQLILRLLPQIQEVHHHSGN